MRGCYPRLESSSMGIATHALSALLAFAACACEQQVVVATRLPCPESPADAGATSDPDASVVLPWSTGFENGFCDYAAPMGFCFATGIGSYSLVTSPVHSGHYAAAFTVRSDSDGGSQVRCVQQGIFPSAAYYGAWYFIQATATNSRNWNLLHYQSGVPGNLPNVWDVSLVNGSAGGPLHVFLRDYVDGGASVTNPTPIPIGQWFHLEVFFRRAKDSTGELTLLQDGVDAGGFTQIVTDPADWGQWYVGNLANGLVPPGSTVFVDDVTIGSIPTP